MRTVFTDTTGPVTATWSGAVIAGHMFRWLLTIFIALAIFAVTLPWLEKLGLGRLPGDVRLRLFGKIYLLPFASTILLSLILFLALRWFR